jgi:hypothetical protein
MYPMICATEYLGRYRYQHMNVIRHQMFLDPALLSSRQIVKRPDPVYLAEKHLLAVFRVKHDVVLDPVSRD